MNVRSLLQNFPLKTGHALLNWMLLAIPVAVVLHYFVHPGPLVMFLVSALAIIPMAGALGEATEDLSAHFGQRVGGLLNATMGNATELIIAFFALRAGHTQLVKASISGSIIGNMLLVFGMSVIAGGIGREKQTFSRHAASVNSTMLFIAVVALVMPAVYDLSLFGTLRENGPQIEHVSVWTSVVLVLVYVLSLLFTFGFSAPARDQHAEPPKRSTKAAFISLVTTTVLVALFSDMLVAQVEPAKQAVGFSELFMGVIIIAIIGNAAEHATAILVARRGHMDLALGIAIGSSAQIALLVAPVLVFASLLMRRPMSLIFSPLEIAGIALAVLIVEMIASDGETTWFEGVQLIAVYLILAVAFYYVPAEGMPAR